MKPIHFSYLTLLWFLYPGIAGVLKIDKELSVWLMVVLILGMSVYAIQAIRLWIRPGDIWRICLLWIVFGSSVFCDIWMTYMTIPDLVGEANTVVKVLRANGYGLSYQWGFLVSIQFPIVFALAVSMVMILNALSHKMACFTRTPLLFLWQNKLDIILPVLIGSQFFYRACLGIMILDWKTTSLEQLIFPYSYYAFISHMKKNFGVPGDATDYLCAFLTFFIGTVLIVLWRLRFGESKKGVNII